MALAGLATTIAPAFSAEIPDFAARIVSADSGDVNGDAAPDAVMLLTPDDAAGEEDHGLLLFFGGKKDDGQIAPRGYYPDLVWGGLPGAMAGNRPSVEIAANGSIRLKSHNDAVGRLRWNQTLTLGWREGQLMLTGFAYGSYDTLAKEARSKKCEVNLLTGQGVREVDGDKEPMTLDLEPMTVADWARHKETGFCGFPE
jgi:hypothetical protein